MVGCVAEVVAGPQRIVPPKSLRPADILTCSRTCFLVAIAAATTFFCGCSHPKAPKLTVVTFGTPLQQDVPIYSQWIGTTVGFIDAEIHSKVTGYLLKQDYKEGSLVQVGDLLFEVDPRPFQAIVDQANAQVDVAKAQLTQAVADVAAAKAERLTEPRRRSSRQSWM
jgi:membrane fusion protein (multidrug efflux system)